MELRSSHDTIIIDEFSKPTYRGGGSRIIRYNGLLVKVFHVVNNKSISVLSEDDFDLLKTIKHENFIDLVERYHRVPKTSENVEAYTYHEIEGKNLFFYNVIRNFVLIN